MPICYICSIETDDTFECSECSHDCCKFCGDQHKKLCEVCKSHKKGRKNEESGIAEDEIVEDEEISDFEEEIGEE